MPWPPKPTPCVLNLAHPLTVGLVFASALQEGSGATTQELVTGRWTDAWIPDPSDNQGWEANPFGWGIWLEHFNIGYVQGIGYGEANLYDPSDEVEGTIECIFMRRSTMASGDGVNPFTIAGGSGRSNGLVVSPRLGCGFTWGRYTGDGGANNLSSGSSGVDLFAVNSWNQIVGVKTADSMYLYLNNGLIASSEGTRTQSWLSGTGQVQLGGERIDVANLRWWNRALNEDERDDLYADPFAMYHGRVTCGNPIARIFGGTAAESIVGRSGIKVTPVGDVPAAELVIEVDVPALGGPFTPESRTINTTAPLTGGGDLSADRTLAISDFIASGAFHARGAVPDPGSSAGSTKFLREDATWDVPSGTGSYTDEEAQDAVGTILADTATINFTYTDATPEIKADVLPGGIKLDDFAAPDDNTDLDSSTSAHGLLKKLPGGTTTFLRADGNFATPASGSGGYGDQEILDNCWLKKFFLDASLLPANERIVASLATVPTETGIMGGGTFTKTTGNATWVRSGSTDGGAYWDMGAARSEMLIVVNGSLRPAGSTFTIIGFAAAAPTLVIPDGYAFAVGTAVTETRILKHAGGANTDLGTPPSDITHVNGEDCGSAFYYNDTTNTLKAFVRSRGTWVLIQTVTSETTYTTMRYAYVSFTGNAGTFRAVLPLTVWSD
jgi:hypothetical protein